MTIDPIWTPQTQQLVFRRLFNAMARPASLWQLQDLTEEAPAWKAVLATLVDGAVSLSDPDGLLDRHTRQLLQAPDSVPEKAGYILAHATNAPRYEPFTGTLESPETGATCLLQVAHLGESGLCLHCQGPGIKDKQKLLVAGLAAEWLVKRRQWNQSFPLGVDFILADEERITALPRTTQIIQKEN
jgi:alpha-D-ribose 1-methylphosphonate 5-triphosphate synthase subunit PhnH